MSIQPSNQIYRDNNNTYPLVLGPLSGPNVTLSALAPSQSVNLLIPPLSSTSAFVIDNIGQNILGQKAFSDLRLSNNISGYLPSQLDFYESITFTLSWNGIFSSNITVNITRIGNICFLRLPSISGGAGFTGTTSTTNLPSRFQSINSQVLTIGGTVNGVQNVLRIRVNTTTLELLSSDVSGNFTSGQSVATNPSTISWLIN